MILFNELNKSIFTLSVDTLLAPVDENQNEGHREQQAGKLPEAIAQASYRCCHEPPWGMTGSG